MTTGGKTGFLGLSHLGLVASVCWASLDGGPVVGVDVEQAAVDSLNGNELPVYEPGLEELLRAHRPRLVFTTDFSRLTDCGLVILARDVPTGPDNSSDLGVVEELVDRMVPHLAEGSTLVLMSQVPAGFTRQVGATIRKARPGFTFSLYYWVETLILGKAVERYLRPERIILGCLDPAAPLPIALGDVLARFSCPILRMSYESAELTKTAINLYLCSSVTFANTLADLCEAVGADWSEIVPALRLDHRIGAGAYLRPGLGIAGGNLERDLVTLSRLCRTHGVDGRFIDLLVDYNAGRYRWVLRQLELEVFAAEDFPTIGVWGLAYKKDTRSTKNSMALRVIADLKEKARIQAYDPQARVNPSALGIVTVPDKYEAARQADCLLIMTDWEEFASADANRLCETMRRPVVVDCVGVLDSRRACLESVRYLSVGRSKPAGG